MTQKEPAASIAQDNRSTAIETADIPPPMANVEGLKAEMEQMRQQLQDLSQRK